MNFKSIKQKGFTLVEVGIVVILLTLITASKLQEEARNLRISIAQSQGQQLKTLNAGLYTYGMRHFNEVVSNSAVAGVANTRAPTVAELVAIGDLTSGFSPNGYYGATYVTSIAPAPAACVAPNCNIAGLVYLNQSINDPFTGAVDGPSIGEAVMAIGADGGSSLRVPGTIQGANGGWSVPNPLGATRGILAARSGLGSELDLTGYLKRDGSLPMNGTLDLGGNSVKSLATVVEGAACTATGLLSTDVSGAVLTCQGGVQTRQGSAFWRDPVLNVAALPACNATASGQTRIVRVPTVGTGPRAYVCTGIAWSAIAVDDNGNLTVAGTVTTGKVQVNDVVTVNAACAPNGLVARDSVGLLLSCQTSIWKAASGGSSGIGESQTWQNMAGSGVGCSAVRNCGVGCTNSTGKPIYISIGGQSPTNSYTTLTVGGVVVAKQTGTSTGGYNMSTLSAIVPNGNTYFLSCVNAGNGVPSYGGIWNELR